MENEGACCFYRERTQVLGLAAEHQLIQFPQRKGEKEIH